LAAAWSGNARKAAELQRPGSLGELSRFTWNCRVELARQGGSGVAQKPT
jgi:hypothetical protein